ncbi:hypothetical protein OHD16_21660 [Sphingobacterium sp. ML3W]|uniref:hypothetical protein n=1 Tax=Sphingobacterium sp. ML3W TaxID=1538644 RepID=UPI002499E761|nr:hypothetical protein [Sphingobacterium sp. ML3W]WFA77340.1 hypothetical protein OGI71_14800 [Sphingobacterium sp. ML3W]
MKHLLFIIFMSASLFFTACQSPSPENFFGKVVLNTNLVADFAPERFGKRLEQETVEFPDIPSSKKEGNEAQKTVDFKIQTVEKALKDINELHVSDDDAKALKEKSITLFEKVLPVYKNEYTTYAKLCDTKGSAEEKQALLEKIQKDAMPEIDKVFDEVYVLGKSYAEKHNLNVNWGN